MGSSRVKKADGEIAAEGALWVVRVMKVEAGGVFGSMRVEAPKHFRYIALTVEYAYLGSGQAELYPETVALVHTGVSPLQGLSAAPLIFQPHPPAPSPEIKNRFQERGSKSHPSPDDSGIVVRRGDGGEAEQSIGVPVEANMVQRATFVFEFHADCREFCLYFPGREGIPIRLSTDS